MLILYTLFDENLENHAVSLALLLIYIDFDRKVLKRSKSNSVYNIFSEKLWHLIWQLTDNWQLQQIGKEILYDFCWIFIDFKISKKSLMCTSICKNLRPLNFLHLINKKLLFSNLKTKRWRIFRIEQKIRFIVFRIFEILYFLKIFLVSSVKKGFNCQKT
jgi:hypothetical protein